MASSKQVALLDSAGDLTAFRYTDYDVPFWARPNSRPGRWNRVGDRPTQYWSLAPDAAWAELIRAKELHAEDDLELVRMPVWVCRIPAQGLIDLHDAHVQATFGLTRDDLVDDDWSGCHEARVALDGAGARGLIAPSAALDGHASLTILGARRAIDWRSTPALTSTLPAARLAVGRPPEGLLSHVRRPVSPVSQPPLF